MIFVYMCGDRLLLENSNLKSVPSLSKKIAYNTFCALWHRFAIHGYCEYLQENYLITNKVKLKHLNLGFSSTLFLRKLQNLNG